MYDILHRVGVKTTEPATVYNALTTIDGLTGWWTEDVTGTADHLRFNFPVAGGGFDMEILETTPDKRVTWRVADGPAEWIGTTITFDLTTSGDYTIILFKHEGWKEPVEFMNHCSTKWGSFLMSLKQLVETGTGAPAPNDVQISDWH